MAACGSDDSGDSAATTVSTTAAASPSTAATTAATGQTSAPAETTAGAGGDAAPSVPTEDLCGTEPIKIAHIHGFGANAWRKIDAAEVVDEVSVCSNVEVTYAQADFDLQTYITSVNSFVAQGYDAIITYNDFGSQALEALRAAHDAGVVVVPYIADPGGVDGEDYNTFLPMGSPAAAEKWAAWMTELLPKGSDVVFLGGTPGNPSSSGLLDSFRSSADAAGGAVTVLNDQPIDTNWDPAEEQRVMAGVLTEYGDFDAVVSDYGVASVGGIRAFVSAGKKLPPLATMASSNELGCLWQDLHGDNPDFELLTIDGTSRVSRSAVRKALAAINGLDDPDPAVFDLIVSSDTLNGVEPACDPDLPPDADLSSALTLDQLKNLFG